MKLVELMTTVPVLGILMLLPMQPPSTTNPGTVGGPPTLPGPEASSGVDITSVDADWTLQLGVTYETNGNAPELVGQTAPYIFVRCPGGHELHVKNVDDTATLQFRFDGAGAATRLHFGGRMRVKGLNDTQLQYAESSVAKDGKQLKGQTIEGVPFTSSYDESKNDNWDDYVYPNEFLHETHFQLKASVVNQPY